MGVIYKENEFSFLRGGGEMGILSRKYQWENTSIGRPHTWPQSLRTTLSIILNSKFPMFLWWGNDLIQFYNDAYRPSLGDNGKHPQALGQRAQDCWLEIWPIIKPLIDQVYSGGDAVWQEDQLIPIFRNGKIEDVYWTFGYSAINDETGKVGGVLVVCNETTEKVNYLRVLQDKEQTFRNTLSQAPVAVAIFKGITFIIEFANKKVLEYWGRTLEEVINKPLFVALPEAAGQGYEALLKHVYTKGERFVAKELSIDLMRKGKLEKTYIDFVYEPYYNLEGDITGVIVLANEITDLVLSIKKIRESEDNYRNIILKAPVAMCIFRGEQHLVEIANERMFKLWGKYDEIIGKPIFDFLPEVMGQGFEDIINNVYKTGIIYKAFGVPVNLQRNKNLKKTLYLNFVYEAFKDASGNINGIIAVVIDVTEEIESKNKIQEAEERTRMAIESAELGFYENHIDTGVLITDIAFIKMLGFDHPISNNDFTLAIHPEDLYIREKAYTEGLISGKLIYELRIIAKDKGIRWIKVTGKVIYDEHNIPIKIHGVVQDITSQKEIDSQKDDFISMVSHELKTPLTSLNAYTNLLNENPAVIYDKELKMIVPRINNQVTRLNNLLNDLMDVTRIDNNQIKFRIDNFDFNEMVNEIVQEVQNITKTHKILVDVIESAKVYADKERLTQVLTNLLNNAIRYSPNATTVIISSRLENNEVVCSIKDFGIGIPNDQQLKIFERFYQLNDNNITNAGFGLGLYISAQIIKRQNGKIWVQSEPGIGSTFYFSLPSYT